jgi:hypothetical protein
MAERMKVFFVCRTTALDPFSLLQLIPICTNMCQHQLWRTEDFANGNWWLRYPKFSPYTSSSAPCKLLDWAYSVRLSMCISFVDQHGVMEFCPKTMKLVLFSCTEKELPPNHAYVVFSCALQNWWSQDKGHPHLMRTFAMRMWWHFSLDETRDGWEVLHICLFRLSSVLRNMIIKIVGSPCTRNMNIETISDTPLGLNV